MEKIPITPQMLHISVKALQKFQLFVKLKDLRDYIQRHYPVETDVKALERELEEKLKYAVYVGLLAKHEDDQYYIPTLREETNAATTAFSAFSEIYKNNKQLPNTRKKRSSTERSLSYQKRKDYVSSSNNDETDSSEDLDFFQLKNHSHKT
ncbi:PREDICTED: uncharacterized protein LOC105561574 isoform X2 [Vollenhovia emeryi]|uniref:uncharacterized protein LOC105561574 isoform X2 n=1 Tax=Vollenhovia emeryi TaxID=411798 RepID=UPI0005F39BAA|nr:PREDICTED: uncharacterized protein LOC105561574 isoform X2 [Vollenhovia emeryi]